MKRFARLFREIDETTKTGDKVDAMARYFADVPPADAAWAVWFLGGNRPKRLLPVRRLAAWAMAEADVPEWLFEECYTLVGDLAETIALLLPEGSADDSRPLHQWVEQLLSLARLPEDRQRDVVLDAWRRSRGTQRLVWNKLVTGGWRVGVSRQLVVRALSNVSGIDEGTIAHRLTGDWQPSARAYEELVSKDTRDADRSRPYPFYLAYPLDQEAEELGDVREWQVEWKWDGIRAQLVRRGGTTYIWTRGEELATHRFPELAQAAAKLPDGTVLDGEILVWKDGTAQPFAQLQRRIQRDRLGPGILRDAPVVMLAYDLLEYNGQDVRAEPLSTRRAWLAEIISVIPSRVPAQRALRDLQFALAREGELQIPHFVRDDILQVSPVIAAESWAEVRDAQSRAREMNAEGLMLKRLDGAYGVGRRKGGWWKWKVQPYAVDAVMIYAQAGHGRRASLHTDYTFALWDNDTLVPFAKAYTGLTDAEIRELDAWIRRNTLEKFGPVRRVDPIHVFEIGFEAIQRSTRHKAGVAVRFPRILRWRTDKTAAEADRLDVLRRLLTLTGDATA